MQVEVEAHLVQRWPRSSRRGPLLPSTFSPSSPLHGPLPPPSLPPSFLLVIFPPPFSTFSTFSPSPFFTFSTPFFRGTLLPPNSPASLPASSLISLSPSIFSWLTLACTPVVSSSTSLVAGGAPTAARECTVAWWTCTVEEGGEGHLELLHHGGVEVLGEGGGGPATGGNLAPQGQGHRLQLCNTRGP